MEVIGLLGSVVGIIVSMLANYWARTRRRAPDVVPSEDIMIRTADEAPLSSTPPRPLSSPVVDITWNDIIYGVATILGIIAKGCWDYISEGDVHKTKLVIRLAPALILSPIVYAAVYAQFIRAEITIPNLCLAFQNGFFWQSVMQSVQGPSSAGSHNVAGS